jgi:hypothetical protein
MVFANLHLEISINGGWSKFGILELQLPRTSGPGGKWRWLLRKGLKGGDASWFNYHHDDYRLLCEDQGFVVFALESNWKGRPNSTPSSPWFAPKHLKGTGEVFSTSTLPADIRWRM